MFLYKRNVFYVIENLSFLLLSHFVVNISTGNIHEVVLMLFSQHRSNVDEDMLIQL